MDSNVDGSVKESASATVELESKNTLSGSNKKTPLEHKFIPTSFDDETVTALKLFQDGYSLLSLQVERFKRGEQLDMLELVKFCRRLIESTHAIISL